MLWDASILKGYVIKACDGQIGRVSDVLFEDVSWIIRWLVVDTGNWLSGRKVLLPRSALGEPDPSRHHFPIKLTMQEVKDGPDIDSDRPVSRQHETHIYHYYGWEPYWGSSFLRGDTTTTPFAASLSLSASEPRSPVRDFNQQDDGDPHLRSIEAVTGHHVQALDGEIGHVEDLLVEDTDWSIRYIEVDTGNWWPGNRVLLSPHSVRKIDWATRVVHLNVYRDKVKNSPPYDPSVTVDGAYDESFLQYYVIKWTEA
jgi:hypothetical protein